MHFCTDEGEADGHLGVKIKVIDNKLTLKQPQIMKRTIELLGLMEASPKYVPVDKPSLDKYTNVKDRVGDDFYRRLAIGLLRHLSNCTRPDT